MSRPPVVETDAWTAREIFNREYLPRIERGELIETVRTQRHPTRPLAREPHCTWSQLVEYRDVVDRQLVRVAVTHRYLRPDGTIGLSGRPDPKQVRHEGKIYRVKQGPSACD